MTLHRTLPLLLSLFALPSCLSASARVAAGPSLATDGEVGYEVSVSLGLGVGGRRSAVWARPGFQTSSRGAAAFTETVGVASIEESHVLSAGFGGELASTSRERSLWLSASALKPLRYNDRVDPGHEKIGFGGTSRWALSAGLESRAGLLVDVPEMGDSRRRGSFSLLPAIDFSMTSTLDL